MTSALHVDTIAAKNGTDPVTLTKQEATKSRLMYDQTNVEIDGSFNVSSVTDIQTGNYAVPFTNNLSLGYSIQAGHAHMQNFQNECAIRGYNASAYGSNTVQTTNGYNVINAVGTSAQDAALCSSMTVGDLA